MPSEGRLSDGASSAVVVGGGVAGLVLARDLAIGGMTVTLLEASDRLGGKVARHRVAGIELDAGAESFATRGGTVAALARALDLDIVPPRREGAWLQTVEGRAIPLPATSLLGIPGTPLAADVIEVIGTRAALRAQLDLLLPDTVGVNERTLGGLVRKRMGHAVLDKLVAPIVTGIHSRHPDDLDLDRVAPGLRAELKRQGSLSHAVQNLRAAAPAGSAVAGIRGGVYELVDRLADSARRVGVEIRLSSRVSAADAHGVTLDGQRFDADVVVLATPLDAAGAPAISLATFVIDDESLDGAPRGSGMLVATDADGVAADGVAAKALTHSTAKWPWLAAAVPPHRHVIRLSYDSGVEDLERAALRDAAVLLGAELAPDSVLGFDRVDWPAVPQRPPVIPGVTVVGESVSGTGLAAVISGSRKEAERLLGAVET